MNTDTKVGKFGQGDTSSAEPQKGEVSVPQRLDDLEKRAKEVSDDFKKLEKGIEKHQNFTYFIVGTIAIVFAVTSILIALDYFVHNEERYEKFIDKTEEMKQSFSTKEQVDSSITSSATQIKNDMDSFKKCLKDKNYWEYDQCYK